jgi:hypothetical protein
LSEILYNIIIIFEVAELARRQRLIIYQTILLQSTQSFNSRKATTRAAQASVDDRSKWTLQDEIPQETRPSANCFYLMCFDHHRSLPLPSIQHKEDFAGASHYYERALQSFLPSDLEELELDEYTPMSAITVHRVIIPAAYNLAL